MLLLYLPAARPNRQFKIRTDKVADFADALFHDREDLSQCSPIADLEDRFTVG